MATPCPGGLIWHPGKHSPSKEAESRLVGLRAWEEVVDTHDTLL